MARDEARRAAA